jgi:hypothetical protein
LAVTALNPSLASSIQAQPANSVKSILHDQYNMLSDALRSGKHPKTGGWLTDSEEMLAKEKMKVIKNQLLGDNR